MPNRITNSMLTRLILMVWQKKRMSLPIRLGEQMGEGVFGAYEEVVDTAEATQSSVPENQLDEDEFLDNASFSKQVRQLET